MKIEMKLVIAIAVVILLISLIVAKVGATAIKGQEGDECNVHAEDESHMCLQGLTCVPQNESSQGNGKCADLNTATPSCTPTASPTEEPTASPQVEETATPTPQNTPEVMTSDGGDGRSDNLGCSVFDCSGNSRLSPYDGSVVGWK